MHAKSFIGRDSDLATVLTALGTSNCVTLVGTFGVGKTRLAQEIAQIRSHPLFVDCTSAFDREELFQAVLSALEISNEHTAIDQIVRAIESRQYDLVVFDNVEQVLEPAKELVAALTSRTSVLVTTREALGLPEENVVNLHPLSTDDALSLFVSRARLIDPDFSVADAARTEIIDFLAKLDCLPLVIELAAGRINTLAPRDLIRDLVARFDAVETKGLSPRQASVFGAVAWSWDLLDDDERRQLEIASAFRGTFNFDGFEAAGGTQTGLNSLVEKSLLRSVTNNDGTLSRRFMLYESVQRFVRERVSEDARKTTTAAIVDFFDQDARRLLALSNVELTAQMDYSNTMMAFENTADNATLALALNRYLEERGTLALRRSVLEAVYSADKNVSQANPTHEKYIDVATELASVYIASGLVAQATQVVRELAPETPDPCARVAFVEMRLAMLSGDIEALQKHAAIVLIGTEAVLDIKCLARASVAQFTDDPMSSFEAAIAYSRRLNGRTRAKVRNSTGSYALSRGDYKAAERQYSLALTDLSIGDVNLRAAINANLGLVAHHNGNLAAAHDAYTTARETFDRLGLLRESGLMAGNIGAVAIDQNELEFAGEVLADARFILEQCDPDALRHVNATYATLQHARGNLSRAMELYSALTGIDFVAAYLAIAKLAMGDIDDAKNVVESVIDPTPMWGFALEQLAPLCGAVLKFNGPFLIPQFVQNAVGSTDAAWLFARLLADVSVNADSGSRELRIDRNGHWFEIADVRTNIARRGPARKLFIFLANEHQNGTCFDLDALFDIGWPDQNIDIESAHKRVYAAIGTLRRLGLENEIVTTDDGYQLDPQCAVTWVD